MVYQDEILEFARGLGEFSEEVLKQRDGQVERSLRVLKRVGPREMDPATASFRGAQDDRANAPVIFLVVWEGSSPLRIEVKCDGKLGKLLREKYESVLLSQTLGGSGIEVICSGQLPDDEVRDLIRHSWEIA